METTVQDFSKFPNYNLAPQKQPLGFEQVEGVDFLLKRKAALLVFQTGLGKTFTSLTAAAHVMRKFDNVRTFVFCPVGAIKAFLKECKTLNLPYRLFDATDISGYAENQAKVFIFTHSTMDRFSNLIKKLSERHKVISIIDEAHILQRNSDQCAFLKGIRPLFQIVWLLTATPLMTVNYVKGLYNVINFMKPGFFGSWIKFRNERLRWKFEVFQVRGRTIQKEVILDFINAAELRDELKDLILIRTLEYNINYHYHSVKLEEREWLYYRRAGRGIINGADTSKEHGARLHDLQRVVDWSHSTLPKDLSRTLSSKEKLLLRVLQKHVMDEDFSALIYTEYHDTAQRIKDVLKVCQARGILPITQIHSITGKDSKASRNAVEDKLKPRNVVVCTQSGSQSRNLQKSNQIILYNIPITIGNFIQLIGRVARMDSQFEHQDIHFIEAQGTIDTYKRLLIQDNAYVCKNLFGDNSNLPDVKKLDRSALGDLRRQLLWSFSGFSKNEVHAPK